jgi:hypothetical protein
MSHICALLETLQIQSQRATPESPTASQLILSQRDVSLSVIAQKKMASFQIMSHFCTLP